MGFTKKEKSEHSQSGQEQNWGTRRLQDQSREAWLGCRIPIKGLQARGRVRTESIAHKGPCVLSVTRAGDKKAGRDAVRLEGLKRKK